MKSKKIFFRTDANAKISMGHLVRSVALAEILKPEFEINFIFNETDNELVKKYVPNQFKSHFLENLNSTKEIDQLKKITRPDPGNILVLDGYQFDTIFQEQLSSLDCKTAYIDDLIAFNYNCDLIINQADLISKENYNAKQNTIFCLGPEYVLLRPAFLTAASKQLKKLENIQTAFVSFGGADAGNITYKVLKILSSIQTIKKIHIVSGSINSNISQWKNEFESLTNIQFHSDLSADEMCKLMNECEIAFCPSSSLSLELCAVGTIMITGTTADNQKGYYKALTNKGAAVGIGEWNLISEEVLNKIIIQLLNSDKKDFNKMLGAQKDYIDGSSGERLRTKFLELANAS